MAARTTTTWTCDRCSVEQETEQGKQPAGWRGIAVHNPPLHAEAAGARVHLCRECVDQFQKFIQTLPQMAGKAAS